jgi:hypothetical protein
MRARNGAGEVGEEDEGALEDGDKERLAALVVVRDLRA